MTQKPLFFSDIRLGKIIGASRTNINQIRNYIPKNKDKAKIKSTYLLYTAAAKWLEKGMESAGQIGIGDVDISNICDAALEIDPADLLTKRENLCNLIQDPVLSNKLSTSPDEVYQFVLWKIAQAQYRKALLG